MAGNTSSSSVAFYAAPDKTAMHAGHSWPTDAGVANPSAPCPQAPWVADTATAGARPLTLSGSVCWSSSAAYPIVGKTPTVLDFPGATHYSRTPSAVSDTSKASRWGRGWGRPPPAQASPRPRSCSTERTKTRSICRMGRNVAALFAVRRYRRVGGGLHHDGCRVYYADQWTFVAGVFDAVNGQMRLYASTTPH